MLKKNFLLYMVILFIGVSIMISGYLIRDAVKSASVESTSSIDTKVLNLEQVVKYLNMSEKEVKEIIWLEKNQLSKTGRFSGKMFPYFMIDDKYYFYKYEIDEWLKDVTGNRREYNTIKGYVSQ